MVPSVMQTYPSTGERAGCLPTWSGLKRSASGALFEKEKEQMTLEDILAFQPQIAPESAGPEPSLKDMLFQYYLKHFNYAEAVGYAETYIDLLREQVK
jgi:hypothetical protein